MQQLSKLYQQPIKKDQKGDGVQRERSPSVAAEGEREGYQGHKRVWRKVRVDDGALGVTQQT